jgi:ABC-type branched-subunit amino acid transport system ATPase component
VTALLSGHGVTKRFQGLTAIHGVDFEIPEGVIYGLIGPNGAGKSTLFNLVTGYCRPSKGEIRYRGERIDARPTYLLSQLGIARAFQISKPFPGMSVCDNVRVGAMFGRPGRRDIEGVTADALALAGLLDVANRPAASLTIGTLRKLEIARALATRPQLLLADEPCAGLNPTETEEMIACIRRIRERCVTVWLVEHDMRAVMSICDRIMVIEAGRKIAEGSPREIVDNPRVIEAYLGSESKEDEDEAF